MLTPENILDSVEDTGYKLRKSSSNPYSKLQLACSFPRPDSLLATSTNDGCLNIQDLNTGRVLLTLELQLMASNTPGTSKTVSHRVNRPWSNMISLDKRMLLFTLNSSNQLLLASLSNDHAEVFGDQVCLLGSHETPITTVCVDDKRSVLISGDSSGCVRLWPLSWDALQSEPDSIRWRPKPQPSDMFKAHRVAVRKVACVDHGGRISKFVSVGDAGTVKVWEMSSDHQSLRADMLQSLDCGHGSYTPLTLTAHANLCAMGTECGKIFVWDHEELELLMVAEEPEGIECLSIQSSPTQSLCVCGNKGGSVRVFRPNQTSQHWQVMAECFLGGRVLLNEFQGDCLVLLAESKGSGTSLKQWPISQLPSASFLPQDVEPTPRAAPPPLPTPNFKPPVHLSVSKQVEQVEPEIGDIVANQEEEVDDYQSNGDEENYEEEEGYEDFGELEGGQSEAVGLGDDHIESNIVDKEECSPYNLSRLGSPVLGSTGRTKQEYMEAQAEKFEEAGGEISEEGLKYAARMRNVPLEDKSRYQNLENLNPTLSVPKRGIKKQVDARWKHSVKTFGLSDSDYYVPEWASLDPANHRHSECSGKELLGKMANLEADSLWRHQTALTLNMAAACFGEDVKPLQ